MATGKGKFSADIGEDVIAAALDSVEQRTRSGESLAVDSEPGTGPDDDGISVQAEPQAQSLVEDEVGVRLAKAEARVAELEAQALSARDVALRSAADLDNARKRAQRDLADGVRFANEKLLKDFLPVADNLERALSHGASTKDWASLEQGLLMTQKQFEDMLARHGVRPLKALGQPFDPNLHEAMGTTETADVAPNTVVSEVLRGWMLHDRLVRPALVSVARAPVVQSTAASPASGNGVPAADEGVS